MHAHEIPAGILPTQRDLYYGGAWHAPKAGVYLETINPTYNAAITTAPVADAPPIATPLVVAILVEVAFIHEDRRNAVVVKPMVTAA